MAIDKERVVRIVNGRGVVANQPLPPAMPAYDTAFEGYPCSVPTSEAGQRTE